MKRGWILPLVAGIAASVTTIPAHHSLSGVYDTTRQITVEGVVAQFQFVNPHPFLTIKVEDRKETRQWRLELDNRSELVQIGMSSDTLKAGDRIVVTGNPGRDGEQSLYVYRLDRPADGLRYEQIGTTPRIKIPSR